MLHYQFAQSGAQRAATVLLVATLLVATTASFAGVAGAASASTDYAFAYVDGGDGHVTLVGSDGATTDLGVSAEIVGPVRDFDGDSVVEVPYVTSNNELYVAEPGGDATKLADDARKDFTKVTIGDLNGDGVQSVYYANVSGYIVAVDPGEEPRSVGGLTGVAALSVTDYDGDGDDDLVYVADDSGPIDYYDGRTVNSTEYTSIGANNGLAVGAPADFDGDGVPRVPVVDGAGDVVLVAADGTKTEIVSGSVDKSPVAAADWTGDADPEVIHLESGTVKATTLNGETTTVTADGNALTAMQDAGVASVLRSTDAGVEVRSFDATSQDGDVEITVETTEDLSALEVSMSGPTDSTLSLSAFSESGSYTYTATKAVTTDGTYTVDLKRIESTDGDVVRNAGSEEVVVDATGITVSAASLTDATDGNGTVTPGDSIRVTAEVSGDVDTVTADLGAFDAGTVSLSESGDVYAATVTVGEEVTTGEFAAPVTARDGQGHSDTADTGSLEVETRESSGESGDGSLAAREASIEPRTHDPRTVTRHAVTLTVTEPRGSWNGLRINYSGTGADVSNVGQTDIVTVGIDRADNDSGTTVDRSVRTDLSTVSAGGDGAILTIGLGGNFNLRDGDELVVVYDDARNPPPGTHDVSLLANPQSTDVPTTARLSIDKSTTATATPEPTAEPVANTVTPESTPTDGETPTTRTEGPGFGVAVAVIALLATAALAARRER